MLRLTVLTGARAGARIELARPIVRLGRAPDNDLAFDPNVDVDASAYHAEIRAEWGRYVLVDTGSRNGVFLPAHGMQRVQQHVLQGNDYVQLGSQGPQVQIEVLAAPVLEGAWAPRVPQGMATPAGHAYPANQGWGTDHTSSAGGRQTPNAAYAYTPGPAGESAPSWPSAPPQQQQQAAPAWGAPVAPPPPVQPQPGPPPGKMGQATLLAHVNAMVGQKRGKSTLEIKALVDQNVDKATGRMRKVVGLLIVLVAIAGIAIVALAMRHEDPIALRKELDKLSMNDPRRKELEQRLGAMSGSSENIGRKIYDDNRSALFMLVAHHGRGYEHGGFCTAFAIKPKILASNAHCVRAAEEIEDKGAEVWAHQNDSAKDGGKPKMFRIANQKGHPRYRHTGTAITPDVGLFLLDDKEAPSTATVADRGELKRLGTGDALYVIGFPGRTMDESSPVAVFMYSHVGRITDAMGQQAGGFEDGWLVQHEGQTTPGTSGSPIFDGAGHVVAINAGGLVESNKLSVYKYAMRIDLLEDIQLEGKGSKTKRPSKATDDDE